MATKLVRKAVVVSGLKALTEEQMMADIREVLGYQVVDEAAQFRRVNEILHTLDIEPFNNKSVEAYKEDAIEEAKKRNPKPRSNGWNYTRVTWSWKGTPLHLYRDAVPAFALLRAAQVQKALNAANIPGHFEVEELHRTVSRVSKRQPDPFMVLVVGRYRMYIDVWNEPKFEGRRTV